MAVAKNVNSPSRGPLLQMGKDHTPAGCTPHTLAGSYRTHGALISRLRMCEQRGQMEVVYTRPTQTRIGAAHCIIQYLVARNARQRLFGKPTCRPALKGRDKISYCGDQVGCDYIYLDQLAHTTIITQDWPVATINSANTRRHTHSYFINLDIRSAW